MIVSCFWLRKKTSFVPTKNVFPHPNHAQYITETTPPQSCFFCYKNYIIILLQNMQYDFTNFMYNFYKMCFAIIILLCIIYSLNF